MLSKVTMGVLPLNPKARFCVKCKDYFPVACFVSDDGKDDPTLCNRHEHAKKRLRYCRGCDDFIALDLFTPGKTYSFACRKHLTEYGGAREAQQKKLQDVGQKRRINAWKQCHNDRKRFKQEKIQINQSEIEAAVLIDTKLTRKTSSCRSWTSRPNTARFSSCAVWGFRSCSNMVFQR